jgi:hypothetical protein
LVGEFRVSFIFSTFEDYLRYGVWWEFLASFDFVYTKAATNGGGIWAKAGLASMEFFDVVGFRS